VLIESKAPLTAPLPVLQRSVKVVPFLEPTIDAVAPQVLAFTPGASITLSGANLVGRDTVVVFQGNPAAAQTPVAIGSGASVSVVLPALTAGINTLRVVRRIDLGVTPKTSLAESNVASFILQPLIRRAPVAPHDYLIQVGAADASVPPRRAVTLRLDPAITATQKISLLLNQLNPPPGQAPRSYLFDAAAAGLTLPDQVLVQTQGVAAGDYLVRIRVDGADSPLDVDPLTQTFAAPKVTF
jgi:hypothetical protein